MAASIALNTSSIDVTTDTGSKASNSLANRFKTGLLNRVKQVGENLRNTTREDALFLGLSMGAGFAAKAGAVALLGASTGGIGLAAVGLALAGGAASGLAKATVKHIQAVKNGSDKKFFSRETLMTTVSSAAISAATLGLSEGFEHFTGHSIGETLSKAFHKVSHGLSDKLFALAPGSAAHAQTLGNVPRPMATIPAAVDTTPNLPKPMGTIPAATPIVVATPVVDAAPNIPRPVATIPAAAAVSAPVTPAVDAVPNVPRPVATIPAAASVVAPIEPVAPPVTDTVPNLPKPMATIPATPAADVANTNVPKPVQVIPATAPVTAPIGIVTPAVAETVNVPKPMATVPASNVAEPVQPKIVAAVETAPASPSGQNPNIDKSIRERALAWVRAMHPSPAATPDAPAAPVAVAAPTTTPAPSPVVDAAPQNIPKPIAVQPAAAEVKATGTTTRERAAEWVKKMNPLARPSVPTDKIVDVADMGKADLNGVAPDKIVLRTGAGVEVRMPTAPNVDAELKTVKAAINAAADSTAAPVELDAHKMAAACVTDLPSSQAAFDRQGGVLPNTCAVANGKVDMAVGDYVIVRDAAEATPSAKRGLRVLFANVAERTTDFIARTVTGETLQNMSAEKLAMGTPAP